ncbi:phosphate transporter [Exidia glandulosa HHB12029]|uniref:Phosphate transporter n=1 Tax=Exidia glandulosa HHB12029 TaxID=1314781 RepID=A0A165DWR5_EXIGL|nr:phosphate transporter [Exidia glandulosa HHB12029]
MEKQESVSSQAAYGPASNLNERRRVALAEVDNAKFSWFHVKVCLVAGVGFFTGAYDIFAINIASTMLGQVYGAGGKLNANQDLGVKVASPVGTFVGQLLFGWLADVVGRKRMYGVELCIIIVATMAQALSGSGPAVSVIGVLIVWRFIMGVGIGGDYPLSAVISSEFAATRTRGRLMTAVFAAQGFGNFAAALVALIVVSAYKSAILNDPVGQPNSVDFCWRLLIGLGCIPGAIALYFRLTIPETPRFTMDIERNVKQATQDVDTFLTSGTYVVDPDAVVQRVKAPKASRKDFAAYFGRWTNFKVLLGAAYSWFALDIAFYGLGLNSSIVLDAIGFGAPKVGSKQEIIFVTLKNVSVGNLILSAAGLIPGYWATFLVIDVWGRKPVQLMGFILLTVIFAIMGFAYHAILNHSKGAFVFLYCLANFFQNFGPNTTTFVIPGEAFPTRYRSTGHGISAASGKLGAIIAQVGFAQLKDRGGPNAFIPHILEIFALFMLTGIGSTLLLPETMNRTLEELSNEDQDGFVAGVAGPGQEPVVKTHHHDDESK